MRLAVHMATNPEIVNIDQQRLTAALDQALKNLDRADKEVLLDFSSVRRVSAADVHRLEQFAHAADAKKVKVLLRGVNVDIYKTLKLTRLARELWFVN
jgi:anti-anti-sigma regulatory factor